MSKFLAFTDLHLGVHSNNDIWLNASIALTEELISEAQSLNLNKVIFFGDFFHERNSINNKTLNTALQIGNLFEKSNIHLYLIVGNHDTYLKNSIQPHSLNIFKKFEYLHVIDEKYKFDEYLTLIPWLVDWSDVDTPYLGGHFDISGCMLNENFSAPSGNYEIKDFKRFKQVFSGHFHTPGIFKNINYIGSVMPFTFHDVNSPRGYYIVELGEEDYQMSFKEFEKCPKYKILNSSDEIKKEDIEGNVVKLVYQKELSTIESEKVLTDIQIHNPLLLNTDFKNIECSESEVIEESEDISLKNNFDILYDYLDKTLVPSYINVDVLKKMIENLSKSND